MNFNDPIAQSIYFAVSVCGVLFVAHWLTEVREDNQPTRWQQLVARYVVVVPVELADDDQADDRQADETIPETNRETGESKQQQAESASELITLAQTERIEAETLARLVLAEKIGIRDAVQIGMAARSGEKYQRKTRLLQAAMARQKERFPDRTDEQVQTRERLGL